MHVCNSFKIASLILAGSLILSLCSGCSSESPSVSGSNLTAIAEDLDLSAELIECSVQGDILRVECISPGLDTFGLTVILYSLSESKTLCRADLGEDAWQTGWTEEGFYAVSLTQKIAYLYNSAGEKQKAISLPDSIRSLSFAMLNEGANLCFLGAGDAAAMFLYDIDSGTLTRVCEINGYVEPMGYHDGNFYVSQDNEVLRMPETATYAQTAYSDPQVRFTSIDLGIGTTDTNFCLFRPDREGITYIPFHSVDEVPLAATTHTFVTASSQAEEDILRVYDLQSETIHTLRVPYIVRNVQFSDDHTLVIAARKGDSHRLYQYALPSKGDKQLTTFASDAPAAVEPPPESAASEITVPGGTHILSVPLLSQWPEFPTGCEAVSATMALQYAGESVSVTEFIEKHLPKSADFYEQDGIRYGPDPNVYFIGSPYTSASYGCMAPVIEKALISYFGTDEPVRNTTGTSLPTLCQAYIDRDIPVLIWATIAMLETYPGGSWHLSDGTLFHWPANEHCLVLVGYDEEHYYFNDPYSGSLVAYAKALCESRYEALGSQSLTIIR